MEGDKMELRGVEKEIKEVTAMINHLSKDVTRQEVM